MRIIGIDPGSNKIGVSIIEIDNNGKILHKQWETIKLTSSTHQLRLAELFDKLDSIRLKILDNKPDLVCIEEPVIGLSPRNSVSLIQARGLLLGHIATLSNKEISYSILEINPKTVKKLTTGNGNAKKEDMQKSVKSIFKIKDTIPEDSADALGIAYSGWLLHTKQEWDKKGPP